MLVRAQQNDTLDLLCWRHLRATAGVVEATLELNPGIAALGPILPHGQVIRLLEPDTTTTQTTQTVQLWD